MLYSTFLLGQNGININGRVFSALDSLPVANASVSLVDGQTVKTDRQGTFSLRISEGSGRIQITHIAFHQKDVAVHNLSNDSVLVFLEPLSTGIDEVVVSTGYEKLSPERTTGSYEVIDNELFNRSVGMDVLTRIEDVSTGVYFNRQNVDFNNSGRKSQQDIMIHGVSSMRTGGNRPLIILDNFPYEGDINDINPNDIESVTVLKDAAAASIWGAKAGNGVIVLTSKNAKYGERLQIGFSSDLGLTNKPDLYSHKIISASDYIDVEQFLFEKGYYTNQENSRARPALPPVVEVLIKQRDGKITQNEAIQQINGYRTQDVRDDMLNYIYRTMVRQQYALEFKGGSERSRFVVSTGYDRMLPSQAASKYDRFTIRAQNSLKVTESLELSTGIRWVNVNEVASPHYEQYSDNGYRFPYIRFAGANGEPLAVPKDYRMAFLDTAGNGALLDWHYRPLEEVRRYSYRENSKELMLNVGLDYDVMKWLRLSLKYQYSNNQSQDNRLDELDGYIARDRINRGSGWREGSLFYNFPMGGILRNTNGYSTGHNGRFQLTVNRNWTSDHQLSMLAGTEISQAVNQGEGFSLYGYNPDILTFSSTIDHTARYPVYANLAASDMIGYPISPLGHTTNRFVSIFANGSYTFKKRYILSGSARRDASNLFGVSTNNKWTPLWSLGASWNVHQEPFIDPSIFSMLKLRFTYGYSGNVDNSMTGLATIGYGNNSASTGVGWNKATVRNPPNPFLRWEKVRNMNMGIDFSIVGSRLSGSIDIYRKNTTDLLDGVPVDPTTGIGQMTMNVAATKSKGIDVNLRAAILPKSFKWTSNILMTYNNSWIVKSEREYVTPTPFVMMSTMSPLNNTIAFPAYSYRSAGLDPETGEPRGYHDGQISKDYQALTSGQTTTLEDLKFHGSARPTVYGGFRNEFSYGNFMLSANITYRLNYFFRRFGLDYSTMLTNGNGHVDYYDRWQQQGDEERTHVPAFIYPLNGLANTFYLYSESLVERGDHIRLQDIRFSYSLRQPVKGVSKLSVFAFASNLGILWRANNLGLDPTVRGGIPMPRSFSFGIKMEL